MLDNKLCLGAHHQRDHQQSDAYGTDQAVRQEVEEMQREEQVTRTTRKYVKCLVYGLISFCFSRMYKLLLFET